MWANIGFVAVGVSGIAALAIVGNVYWDDIKGGGFLGGVIDWMGSIYKQNEMFISLDMAPNPLSDNDLKYKVYGPDASDTAAGDEITFGRKYGKLLVGDKESADGSYDWWEQNFNAKKGKATEKDVDVFSNVKTAEANTISTKCKELYKKKVKEIKSGDYQNAWLLCSPLENAPGEVIERRMYVGKVGSDPDYKPHFLEDIRGNANAWKVLYEKTFKSATDTKSEEFKNVNIGYPELKGESNQKSLSQVCFESYQKSKEELDNTSKPDYKKNVLKFCTFTNEDLSNKK